MELKLFISQPMKDKTNEEIEKERALVVETMKKYYDGKVEIEVIDSFFKDAPHDTKPLWFLSKSIELLATADIVYFCKDWYKYRGCQIEFECCKAYGKTVFGEGGDLVETIPFMKSADYKERFIAEFLQIDIRLSKLKSMCEKWDKGLLEFKPTCPRETYTFQIKAMQEYRDVLVIRAKMEGIEEVLNYVSNSNN